MAYTEITKCPVCDYEGQFIALTQVVGPKFDTPEGFHAAFLSFYVRCPVCSTAFQNPMPNTDEWYKTDAYRNSVDLSAEEMDRDEQTRCDAIMNAISHLAPNPKSFLDVGCSRGYLLDAVHAKYGSVVVGVEPNLGYVRSKEALVHGSLEQVHGYYDLIACIHVLEHVPDPIGFLKLMAKHLHQDSKIFVEVPYIDAPGPYRFAHQTIFTTTSLRMAFVKAGLRPEQVTFTPHLLSIGKLAGNR